MSKIGTFATAALAVVPAISMVQPAYAGAAESHELALKVMSLMDDVSMNLQELSKSMGEPVTRVYSIMVASCVIQQDDALHALGEETGLSKRDSAKLSAKHDEVVKKNSAAVNEILEHEDDLTSEVMAALKVVAYTSTPEDNDEKQEVIDATAVLLQSAVEDISRLLGNITSTEDAKNLGPIVAKLDYHVTVLSTYMAKVDEARYDKLTEELAKELGYAFTLMKELKEENYYGESSLRDFCEDKLD